MGACGVACREDVEGKIQAKQKEAEELGEKIFKMQSELQAKAAEEARAVVAQVK
jgi:hypothetical protein